jgi:hypothetical protein
MLGTYDGPPGTYIDADRSLATTAVAIETIANRILLVRGVRVMLDADLAALYGVETRVLVQAVKRNLARFPADFMFQLAPLEFTGLRSQSVISNIGRGGRRTAPHVFTEHGALMAATILSSSRAIEVSIYVMRAFVQFRPEPTKRPIGFVTLTEKKSEC